MRSLPADDAKKPPDIRIAAIGIASRATQSQNPVSPVWSTYSRPTRLRMTRTPGVRVARPGERLLEVGHQDLTSNDPGHEVPAELDRHDREQDDARDAARCVGHENTVSFSGGWTGVLAVRATGRRRRGRASVRGSADEAASEIIYSPLWIVSVSVYGY